MIPWEDEERRLDSRALAAGAADATASYPALTATRKATSGSRTPRSNAVRDKRHTPTWLS